MLVLFMGPTSSGKNSVMDSCIKLNDWGRCVRYTTRPKRDREVDGVDYRFVTVDEYKDLLNRGALVETEEYSNDRFYGTAYKSLYSTGSIICSTITPSGLLKIAMEGIDFEEIVLVYCHCELSDQIARYVKRTQKFDVSDKMELNDRLARDEGMFKAVDVLFKATEKLYTMNKFKVIEFNTSKVGIAECTFNITNFVNQIKKEREG